MKKILFYLALFAAPISFGQTKKVLFIGNSYTGVNNLPNLVNKLAEADNNILIYDANTPGGNFLHHHAVNPVTLEKISAQDWDFVVLQEQSQLPSFSDGQVQMEMYPHVQVLVDSILANNDCTVPVFYNTWGRRDGDKQWAGINTFEKMNGRLHNTYADLTEIYQGLLSPVGLGFLYVKTDENSPINFVDLYHQDGSHPSIHGSYLAASIFNNILFSTSSMGNTYIPTGITEEQAEYLQTVADEVVYGNDAVQTDYRPLTANYFEVEIENNEIHLTPIIENGNFVKWDFGDGVTSTEKTVSHAYEEVGSYVVKMTTGNDCYQQTYTMEVNVATLGLWNEEIPEIYKVYPNPSINGLVYIKHNDNPFTIYSILGEEVFAGVKDAYRLNKGVYFFRWEDFTQKVLVL